MLFFIKYRFQVSSDSEIVPTILVNEIPAILHRALT